MERLTERREDGTATGIKRSIGDFVGIPEMLMRLAEYEDTGMTPQDIADLEAQLQQAQAELNETYIDENGETWFRPTAEAYYAACKARNKWQEQSEEWRVDRDFFLTRLEDEKIKVERLEAENESLREQLQKLEKAMDGVGRIALVIAGLLAVLVIIVQVGKRFYGW